jgi:hypothetical protein
MERIGDRLGRGRLKLGNNIEGVKVGILCFWKREEPVPVEYFLTRPP